MKILVIFITKENHINFIPNILTLKNYLSSYNTQYACISSSDDFQIYDGIINLKYKEISSKMQLSKLSDFIISKKDELDYDWFIKIRPDMKLNQPINFNKLLINSINARAREYKGPKSVYFGSSLDTKYNTSNYGTTETIKVLDDQIFIFHKSILNKFQYIANLPDNFYITSNYRLLKYEHEWFHTNYWKICNINLNIIGIYAELLDTYRQIRYKSGNINI